VLFERPTCEDCTERGELQLSYEVHHVVKISDAPHLRLDERNLRALCTACHVARTRRGE
jgi:5-methylcytosine-specific restriction endonuclease McrA